MCTTGLYIHISRIDWLSRPLLAPWKAIVNLNWLHSTSEEVGSEWGLYARYECMQDAHASGTATSGPSTSGLLLQAVYIKAFYARQLLWELLIPTATADQVLLLQGHLLLGFLLQGLVHQGPLLQGLVYHERSIRSRPTD